MASLKSLCQKTPLRRFLRNQDGASVVEFALYVPLFLMLIFGTFEAGWLMTRYMWIERGMDIAMRDVRLGNIVLVDHADDATPEEIAAAVAVGYEELEERICNYIGGIDDCGERIVLMARSYDVEETIDERRPACRDVAGEIRGDVSFVSDPGFSTGDASQLTVLKLCVVVDPLISNFGLSLLLPLQDGRYQIRAASAFLSEPADVSAGGT